MTFEFELNAGFAIRKSVRQQLHNSKAKLEFDYPDCDILVTEDKDLMDSTFYVQGKNLPDSAETVIQKWMKQIEQWVN